MKPDALLERCGRALYGTRWTGELAGVLGLATTGRNRLREMAKGTRPVPGWILAELQLLLDERAEEVRAVSLEVACALREQPVRKPRIDKGLKPHKNSAETP